MIDLIKTPQRSDYKVEFSTVEDILTVTINDDISEVFDFTGLPDGIAEDIIIENLPVNPILNVKKEDGKVVVEVLRFYSTEEKELFEIG